MKKILLLNLLVATTFVIFAGDSIPNGKKVNSMVLKFSMGINIIYAEKDVKAVNLGINPGVNFMIENKKGNYHNFGFGFNTIASVNKRTTPKNTGGAISYNILYAYRQVFIKKKDVPVKPFVDFYTSMSMSFEKTKGVPYSTNNISFSHTFGVAPGFQYIKNKFFLDVALPIDLFSYYVYTYKFRDQDFPDNNSKSKGSGYDYISWRKRFGVKVGVGVRF
jgi:hypothetical protein